MYQQKAMTQLRVDEEVTADAGSQTFMHLCGTYQRIISQGGIMVHVDVKKWASEGEKIKGQV